jgi:hypothetical protein
MKWLVVVPVHQLEAEEHAGKASSSSDQVGAVRTL